MRIKIYTKNHSKLKLQKSGEFILQNIDTLPKKIIVSGNEFFPSKTKRKAYLQDNEFIFDKSKKIIIFKIKNIYNQLDIDIINETNKN